jgi:hypothetical protein
LTREGRKTSKIGCKEEELKALIDVLVRKRYKSGNLRNAARKKSVNY